MVMINLKIKSFISALAVGILMLGVQGVQVAHAGSSYLGGSVGNTISLKRGFDTVLTHQGERLNFLENDFGDESSHFGISVGNTWRYFELGLDVNVHSQATYAYPQETTDLSFFPLVITGEPGEYITYGTLANQGVFPKISTVDYLLSMAFLIPISKLTVSLDFGVGSSKVKGTNLITSEDTTFAGPNSNYVNLSFTKTFNDTAGVAFYGIGLRYKISNVHSLGINYRYTIYVDDRLSEMSRTSVAINYRYYFADENSVVKDKMIKNQAN